jgi:hypothetical protein
MNAGRSISHIAKLTQPSTRKDSHCATRLGDNVANHAPETTQHFSLSATRLGDNTANRAPETRAGFWEYI